MNKTTTITEGQSLVDVAIQELGTVAGLFDLADEAGLAITDLLTPGQVLPVPTSPVARPELTNYFVKMAVRVNTGDVPAPAPATTAQRYFSSLFFNPDYFA